MPDWRAYVRDRLHLTGVVPQREQDVIDDLAGQLEEAYRDALGRGLPDPDAVAAAVAHVPDWRALARQVAQSRRLAQSPLDRLQTRADDAAAAGNRRAGWAGGLLQDVRFAVRVARRAPGFTAVAVLTLALGIGANTTIFSWINAILLNPLPGVDASRIVDVGIQEKNGSYTSMSYPDFMDLRAASNGVVSLLVHDSEPAALSGPAGSERIWIELVSDNFFDVLQVRPSDGRAFRPEEGLKPVPVAVISERLAQRRFGAGAPPVGQTIDINGTPFTIVGVAPADFVSGYTGLAMDAWLPIPMQDKITPGGSRVALRGNHWLNTLGRLEPGVTTSRATTELSGMMARIAAAAGVTEPGRAIVDPLWRSRNGAQSVLGLVLLVLMSMAAIVLLIACGNLANLLLSRASARRQEFALRLSLGCSRARLVRQLLTEAVLLVSVAAALAMAAQVWSGGLLMAFVPPTPLPVSVTTHLDGTVTLFALATALASAVIFGLAPALQAGRSDLVTSLKGESGRVTGRRAWLRHTLVVSQVALSLFLLAAAGLFLRSLEKARLFDPGFRTQRMLLSSVDLFSAGYDRTRGTPLLARLLDEIRALPGVESASLARRVPLGISTGNSSTSLEPEGYMPPKDDPAYASLNWVGPDYFKTMGIPVVAGREYSAADRPDQPETFVVNQTFADRYWPGQSPIGRRVRYGKNWYVVSGVVANSKYRRLNEPASPFLYLSTTWNYRPDVTLHIRTASTPESLIDAVRALVKRADATLPVFGVMSLEDYVRSASFQQRMAAWLLSAFGGLALLLASVGLYATLAYSVSRRTRELGARLALGATRTDIIRLVLGQAARLTSMGVVIGLALAIAAAPLFSALLVGIRPVDVPTLATVTVLLLGIAGLASYMPARRAARLDPLQALRHD